MVNLCPVVVRAVAQSTLSLGRNVARATKRPISLSAEEGRLRHNQIPNRRKGAYGEATRG
jgi:hypothetical protein